MPGLLYILLLSRSHYLGSNKENFPPTYPCDTLKVTWVKRYLNNNAGLWKLFFDYYLSPFSKTFLFECNFRQSDITDVSNTFIRQICNAWGMLQFSNPAETYGDQIHWNNNFIKIDGCITYDKKLHMAGVIYVRDLFKENYVKYVIIMALKITHSQGIMVSCLLFYENGS